MTDSPTILIYHAPDCHLPAKNFSLEMLEKHRIQCETLAEIKARQGNVSIPETFLSNYKAVIILPSQDLFRGCLLRRAVNYALSKKIPVISAYKVDTAIIAPTWYKETFSHIHDVSKLRSKLGGK